MSLSLGAVVVEGVLSALLAMIVKEAYKKLIELVVLLQGMILPLYKTYVNLNQKRNSESRCKIVNYDLWNYIFLWLLLIQPLTQKLDSYLDW